jgi:two-component system chemotaxis response regulator CheY
MKRILLVDDSATILLSMSQVLSRAGYQVDQASSGAVALQALSAGGAPDLIITDYNMPGMNGVELIKAVRQLPACRFLPILVLTTESQDGKRAAAKAAGATGWLVKPVAPDQLIAVLKQVGG